MPERRASRCPALVSMLTCPPVARIIATMKYDRAVLVYHVEGDSSLAVLAGPADRGAHDLASSAFFLAKNKSRLPCIRISSDALTSNTISNNSA